MTAASFTAAEIFRSRAGSCLAQEHRQQRRLALLALPTNKSTDSPTRYTLQALQLLIATVTVACDRRGTIWLLQSDAAAFAHYEVTVLPAGDALRTWIAGIGSSYLLITPDFEDDQRVLR